MAYHEPVLFKAVIDGLKINPSGIYVDTTFGGGGHSRGILERLKGGQLISFDQDSDTKANIVRDNKFHFIHGNFRFISNYLRYYGFEQVDGILADLGVSSHHFNQPQRGFSYRFEANLDMRMNLKAVLNAEHVINEYPEDKLIKIFSEYGELNNVSHLVKNIVRKRDLLKIQKTNQFVDVISDCIPRTRRNQYLSKVFQALRIEVNKEITNLKEFLLQSPKILKKGGRLVIISYHSLEDRLVKNFIRWGNFYEEVEKDIYGNYKVPFKSINKKPIIPDVHEIMENSRARSAKLRIAEKK